MSDKQEKPQEYKSFPFKLTKLDTEGRTLEGYASVFDTVDLGGDRVHKGAFRKTLEQRGDRVKFLWQHDTAEPLGRPIEMREDKNGLFVKAIISKTRRGLDTLELLSDGAIDELSIGYDAIKGGTETSKDDDGNEIRELKELRLYEFSLVTFAMNQDARVTDLKEDAAPSEFKPEPEVTENTIRIRVRDPGDFEDDSFRTINIGASTQGIKATVGRLKGENTMTIQSYVFDKEKWTVEDAQAWVDEHKKDDVPEMEEKIRKLTDEEAEHFWEKVDKTDKCWLWTGATDKDGYGAFKVDGETERANRVSYVLAKGAIPAEKLICHSCDNALCVKPDHLSICTSQENNEKADAPAEEQDKTDDPDEEQGNADDPETKEPPEAVVFASVVLQDTLAKLDADTWEYRAAELALSKLRGLYGDEVDVGELEEKAGRVLAGRNAQRIGQALSSLISVLEDAGIDILGIGEKPETETEEEDEDKDYSLEIETAAAELDLFELEY